MFDAKVIKKTNDQSRSALGSPTCALRETWNVRIRKRVLTLEGVGQHPQPRAADDRHLGALLGLRQQPISCLLVVVVTANRQKRQDDDVDPVY